MSENEYYKLNSTQLHDKVRVLLLTMDAKESGSDAQAKEAQAKEEPNPLAQSWQNVNKAKGKQNVANLGSFSFRTKEEQKKAESALPDPRPRLQSFKFGTPPVAPAKAAPATQDDLSPVDSETPHVGATRRAQQSSDVQPEQRTKSGQDFFAPTVMYYIHEEEGTKIKTVVVGAKRNKLYDVVIIKFVKAPYSTERLEFKDVDEFKKNQLIHGMTPCATEMEANLRLGLDQRGTINPLAQMRLRLRI